MNSSGRFGEHQRVIAATYSPEAAEEFNARAEELALLLESRGWEDEGNLVQPKSMNLVRKVRTQEGRVVVKSCPGNAQGEVAALKYFYKHGILCPQVLETHPGESRTITVLEFIQGRPCASGFGAPGELAGAAKVLTRIHQLEPSGETAPLVEPAGFLEKCIEWCSRELQDNGVPVRMHRVLGYLDPQAQTPLHGDPTPANFLLKNGKDDTEGVADETETWVIDPLGLAGDPAWDWGALIGRGMHGVGPRPAFGLLKEERGVAAPKETAERILAVAAFSLMHYAASEFACGPVLPTAPEDALARALEACPDLFG